MGFLLNLLTLPMLGAPQTLLWLAGTIADEAQRQSLDEGRVRAGLMELRERYDAGAIEDQEYDQQERALLKRLNDIRELKARYGSR